MTQLNEKWNLFSFQEMIEDWSGNAMPDLLYHVPFEYKFVFVLKKYELVTLANEFNWIDSSESWESTPNTPEENSKLAICGDLMNLKFSLPFLEFLPTTILHKFVIEVICKKMCLYRFFFLHIPLLFLKVKCANFQTCCLQSWKVDLSLLLPETNTSRDILKSLDLNAKVLY